MQSSITMTPISQQGEEERTLGNMLRKGAAQYPRQITRRLVSRPPETPDGAIGVCALEAIYVGLTGNLTTPFMGVGDIMEMVERDLHISRFTSVSSPLTTDSPLMLEDCITRLNDQYTWSFEQIAAWLDTKPWEAGEGSYFPDTLLGREQEKERRKEARQTREER